MGMGMPLVLVMMLTVLMSMSTSCLLRVCVNLQHQASTASPNVFIACSNSSAT